MNNSVTVVFSDVDEFIQELREACQARPHPEVVCVTHRLTERADLIKRTEIIAGFVTNHSSVPEIITLAANCGAHMFADGQDPEAVKVAKRASVLRERLILACNELGLAIRGGMYNTGV